MSLKTIVTHGSRVCGKCNGKIEKGVEAKADFERTPYYFEHIKCPGVELTEEEADQWEMLFAILADHSVDLIKLKGMVQAIYEKVFPGTPPNTIAPGDVAKGMQGSTLVGVPELMGAKK